jgi:hypothetical protein
MVDAPADSLVAEIYASDVSVDLGDLGNRHAA